jgi:hypothetical protein
MIECITLAARNNMVGATNRGSNSQKLALNRTENESECDTRVQMNNNIGEWCTEYRNV